MRCKAASILAISLRWRSRARSSMARSVSDEARSARSGWFCVLVLQMLEGLLGFLQDFFLPGVQLCAEIVPLPLVHERLFVGRPVGLGLVLGPRFRSPCRHGWPLSMAIDLWPFRPFLAVVTRCWHLTIHGFYAVDPLLVLHFDPTLLERASLLAGRAYRASRVPDKHGIMAANMREHRGLESGRNGLPGGPILAISTSRRSSISASTASSRSSPEASRKVGGGRLQPQQGRRPEGPPRTSILSSSEGIERHPAPLDRAARRSAGSSCPCSAISASMPPMVRSDAAAGVDFGASLSSTEIAGRRAARRGRVRDLGGGVRSGDAHGLPWDPARCPARGSVPGFRRRWPGMVNRR